MLVDVKRQAGVSQAPRRQVLWILENPAVFVSFNEEFLSAIPVAKASVLHTGETKSGRKMLSLSSAHSAVGRDAATQDDLQGNPGMVGRTERTE